MGVCVFLDIRLNASGGPDLRVPGSMRNLEMPRLTALPYAMSGVFAWMGFSGAAAADSISSVVVADTFPAFEQLGLIGLCLFLFRCRRRLRRRRSGPSTPTSSDGAA